MTSNPTYVHYGHEFFDKNIFSDIENSRYLSKPNGGLWASNTCAKYSWKHWCLENNFVSCTEENKFCFTLSDDARVLYINDVKDLETLSKIDSDLRFVSWVLLDFENLMEFYDAIEVNISADPELYFKLYGWDCDSILIMNPNVIILE